jgi:two-component system CheB/CheR fusion protein
MVGDDLRARLRSAILRVVRDDAPVTVSGGHTAEAGRRLPFVIEVRPVRHDGELFLLIHFLDRPGREADLPAAPAEIARVAELERELRNTHDELRGAVRSLEILGDEQRVINENALSVNEEFQATNEELLTSKEELQSLNEELTALNSQLQETLERQRSTSNDLQNVLYSADVATLFLDADLRIRFFTPATKALFNVIKTDVGRPLADLRSLAADAALSADARGVLETLLPIEREIETTTGVWSRRVMPYRTHDGAVEGVVITFTDITGRRHAAEALEAATREAERANVAKSHFLAAASHDLRQPLQTLALIQGLLAKRVAGTPLENLVSRLEDTVGAMSGMLNTLLDINQIEAGVVRPEPIDLALDDLFRDLRGAFAYQAQAQRLDLRVVFSGLVVHSDPRLLEQMLRNLVANALKYTPRGKVLLGARRDGGFARIEVWDTGIGIADHELSAIFEEYRQLQNPARERTRGLGLGLSIVHRLGGLLGHRIRVRSWPGKGSVFSVEVPLSPRPPADEPPSGGPAVPPVGRAPRAGPAAGHAATVLVVEDDPELRELLALILTEEGHHPVVVADGPTALDRVRGGGVSPDILLTDYNLPNGLDGLRVAAALRAWLGHGLPVIVLTGDISTRALKAIAAQRCLQLNKPMKPAELTAAIQSLLATRPPTAPVAAAPVATPPVAAAPVATPPVAAGPLGAAASPAPDDARRPDGHVVYLVDDDRHIRDTVRLVLEDDGRTVLDFATGEAFLAAYRPGSDGCLLIDASLPGMGGLQLLRRLRAASDPLPAIMITGSGDVPMAVEAMKAGAADFIEKPIGRADLLASIDSALERSRDSSKVMAWQADAAGHIAGLTPRQHQIMDLVLAGHPSKNIAADLGISQRTVENHRASIMRKTGATSLPALARLALAAAVPERP